MKSSLLAAVIIVLLSSVGLCGDGAVETRYSVCGTVSDASGRPLRKAFVQLYGPNVSKEDAPLSHYVPAIVDAEGHFKYDAYVPKGTYWLAVCPHNASENVCAKRLKNVVVGPKHSSTGCDVSLTLTADANGVQVAKTR